MSLCKSCLKNRLQREGGPLGLCWRHSNQKCRMCAKPSDGKDVCAMCAHIEDIERWKAESLLRVIDTDDDQVRLGIRKERLWEAKYHAHRAVEIFFRGLLLSTEALWGDIGPKDDDAEQKKAA